MTELQLDADSAREIAHLLAWAVACGQEQERYDASWWRGVLQQFATQADYAAQEAAA